MRMDNVITAALTAARVLVVDDEPSSIVTVREALTTTGKRVVVAESAEEALRFLEEDPFDLVLADDRILELRSGLELVGVVCERFPSLPVLLMTHTDDPGRLAAALDLGATGVLPAPFGADELLEKVERVLLRKSRAEAEVRKRLVGPTIAVALANAIEVKDAEIHGQVERLSEIALAIGRRLRLGRNELQSLEIGAVLHDVGKIGIPDQILLKPSALSPEEREVMKAHAVIGDQMLRHLGLDAIRPAVRHHHERWDGTGYPDQLAGHEIPLLARVLAVADSIEAMTAQRPYRGRLQLARLREELAGGRGHQWDPHLVDLAVDMIDDGTLDLGADETDETVSPSREPVNA
jgi:putative two-component system response regulator